MAHLSDDRAQMLLIGGLAIAVAFVALALVLNSSVYVENIANRENAIVGGEGPQVYQSEVRRGVGRAIVAGNANASSFSDRQNEVERGVGTLGDALRVYHAERGRAVDVSVESHDEGTRVFRTTDGDFTSPGGGSPNWDLTGVDQASRFRYFSLNVSRTGLKDIVLPTVSKSDVFRIEIDDGVTVRKIFIYRNSLTGETIVESTDPSGVTCVDDDPRTDINVTAATVDGEHCEALDFFESVDRPYDVRYRNAGTGNVSGRYDFTAEEPSPSPNYGADSNITTQEVVYDTTVEVVYYSPDARYVADLRVAPGEPRA